MKIRLSQLRSIIKEEVARALKESRVPAHEGPDEARSNLYLGMKTWIQDPAHGWPMIKAGLQGLVDDLAFGEDEIMEELFPLEEELGYSEDDVMDLETSVRNWLSGGG